MAARKTADFLVEVGTEELPPKALRRLMLAFARNLELGLADSRLAHGDIKPYASPRRIAALVSDLALAQESRDIESKGPPVHIAFDDHGKATAAAVAFAGKVGVGVEVLERSTSGKGEWLVYRSIEQGQSAAELLAGIVNQALMALPMQRRMRWGASDIEFVRPVHWVILLHGNSSLPGVVLGRKAGNKSYGHRFLSRGELKIDKPENYLSTLEKKGYVLADFDLRQHKIMQDVGACAASVGGSVLLENDALYEEVAALTEWPVAMSGRFDETFLALPAEAIIASLVGHQRFFPVADAKGNLLPAFIMVANIDSTEPDKVRNGNERVLRSRLADAAFFWRTDRDVRLEDRASALQQVVYQKGLGSLCDKSARIGQLCAAFADEFGVAGDNAVRAAGLAKCDLLSGMVGEFPELQGIMGGYYAQADGEPDEVVTALGEQYLPRFAGDVLPVSPAGQLLALADKLDTLAGIFALGKKPSGSKDPFALRRAALGIIRILVECGLELRLHTAIRLAISLQPIDDARQEQTASDLDRFIEDRLRHFYLERPGVSSEVFDAVNNALDRLDMPLPDFDRRIDAVMTFASLPEASSLAAANKRISNILQQSEAPTPPEVDPSLFQEPPEAALYAALGGALAEIAPLQARREYAAALTRLAALREPVDLFFDAVLVMTDDAAVRQNRLALLSSLRAPFQSVADISRLVVSKTGR